MIDVQKESKEISSDRAYELLVISLYDLIKSYRTLLSLVRNERDILISADMDKLNESNCEKDILLVQVRSQEKARQKYARDYAHWVGADVDSPQLLDLSQRLINTDPEKAEKLRGLHSVLTLLLKRLGENNRQNEELVKTALNNITGAMNAIKDALTEKPTYEGSGAQKGSNPGQLVRREI
jgi:flagellar biosynthesis/type III secretory pathway chaperone